MQESPTKLELLVKKRAYNNSPSCCTSKGSGDVPATSSSSASHRSWSPRRNALERLWMRTLLMDSLRLLFFISMENVMLRMSTLVWESQLLMLAIEFFGYLLLHLKNKPEITIFVILGLFRHFETVTNIRK
jgi:hypothetical protein